MQEKRLPKLDGRLSCILEMLSGSEKVADIGCDHGRLSLALAKSGRKVIATDISKPSLNKTRQISKKHNADIDIRLGDGLSQIARGEVDAAVIAGMGHKTIIAIIENSKDTVMSMDFIVVQSMNGDYEMRSSLADAGFGITDERLVSDGRRLYCIIKAVPNKPKKLSETEKYLGPVLIETHGENFAGYLDFNIRILSAIIRGMTDAKSIDAVRLNELIEAKKNMEAIKNAES